VLFNGHHERLDFTLPPAEWGKQWLEVVNTATGFVGASEATFPARGTVQMAGRSLVVLKREE
jgi:glycogen operon protein